MADRAVGTKSAREQLFGTRRQTVTIRNLKEYVALKKVSPLIYRGQSNVEWLLEPGIIRFARVNLPWQRDYDLVSLERHMLTRFVESAPLLTASAPASVWEWLVVAQHHGLPTRLLDWSTNALVALYFAVESSDTYTDAVVWQYAYAWTQEINARPAAPLLSLGDEHFAELHSFTERSSIAPLFPRHFNPRIRSQNSVFTVHELRSALEPDPDRLRKIVIPQAQRGFIRSELRQMGIHGGTLFPDLDGLAREIKESFQRTESRPSG